MAGADRGARLDATLWPWLLGTVVNLGLSGLSMATHRAALSPGEVTVILAAGSATLVFAPMAMIFPPDIPTSARTGPPGVWTVPLASRRS